MHAQMCMGLCVCRSDVRCSMFIMGICCHFMATQVFKAFWARYRMLARSFARPGEQPPIYDSANTVKYACEVYLTVVEFN